MSETGRAAGAGPGEADKSILSRGRGGRRAAAGPGSVSRLQNLALAVPVTGRGVALALAAAGLLLAGWIWGYPEFATLGAAAALACVAAGSVIAARPRLEVERSVTPDRISVGHTATVQLNVRNAGRWRAVNARAVDAYGGPGLETRRVAVPLARLRPGRSAGASYAIQAERRGVVDAGPLGIGKRDLLGLAATAGNFGPTARLWIHPRLHQLARTPDGLARSLEGTADKVEQGSLTFHALREYVIGDELRHVHWRTSARIGKLMVKEHLDTSLPTVAIAIDDRAEAWAAAGAPAGQPWAAPFEAACEAAYSVLTACFRAEYHAALVPASGAVVSGAGRDSYGDLLAELNPDAKDSLSAYVSRLTAARYGDTLVWITGTEPPTDRLATLKRAYPTVIAVHLAAGLPTSASLAGGVPTIRAADGEQFAAAWNNGGTRL
ncbi:DUF58 domain-containing protein [Glycomyces algeriensis]|uniref:DUF58 domain-containing protein n=1 Tax=Glycomyces algeriensis TaxID=256037 RepID=A0A9W6LG86_9ACTN|nr:DUF58 domain-containing protein [Glycomyces algeriensis]MDA1365993.1 DUF58 domain-containing protein [Glycomyces algeriensis]MDR7349240.1 uncharacterized protein (DUF58 family) [Glycomyces algeriensis]GLI41940.1 hypothetical protein GALLR39Z86_17900 [Glycomyces algeriensis]